MLTCDERQVVWHVLVLNLYQLLVEEHLDRRVFHVLLASHHHVTN